MLCTAPSSSPARSWASASGTKTSGVTAIIDDHEDLRLNVSALDAAENTIDHLGHASRNYALLGDSGYREPSLIAGSPAQATGRRSDFFTANLIGDRLQLQLWRVGDAP